MYTLLELQDESQENLSELAGLIHFSSRQKNSKVIFQLLVDHRSNLRSISVQKSVINATFLVTLLELQDESQENLSELGIHHNLESRQKKCQHDFSTFWGSSVSFTDD